ncbi:response regulator, partial [Amphritea sp.]|uniref:response regulator n=1 Tax=Amphritea sp. TaxID=1872502 RepID=UPI00356B2383
MLTSEIEGTTMQNTLLVIDDEKAILRSLRRTLHHAGYKVVTAESGTEALQILEDNRHIRVVISDYRMPNMTGGELLTKIKQRFSDVIGIMLTGYADIESV